MKKFSILCILVLLFQSLVFAAAPTVPGSNLTFKDLDGAQFEINFTGGNGTSRIIVMKEGSAVTGLPVNGVEYTANSGFGTAGSQFTAAGEYVVAKTSWASYNVTNLKPGTTYFVAIFEYNGSGVSIQYLMLPLTGSQSTVVAPTTSPSAVSATAITGNTISLGWAKGNGTGRIIVARKGAAVNITPTDLTNYYTGDGVFESGTKIGTDNYVVYKANGTSTTIKNLEPNTLYHFAIFEYNGSVSPVFLSSAATFNATTNAGPTLAATSPGFSYVEGSSYTIGVTYGNGTRRLFIARKEAPVTAVPTNGIAYTANAAFGSGFEIAPGEFVVAATTGNSVNVTNLEPNTVYHFRVYEYDADKTGNTYYLTSSYAVKSGSTATTPATVCSNLHTTALTGSSATIAFTPGSGTYRMVLMKAGSAVDAAPVNLTKYAPSSIFGNGAQIGSGNYVMHWGMNGSSFPVSNLQPGVTYHVSMYEFNGYNNPVYSATGATFSFTPPLEPTSASTSPWTVFVEGSSFRLVWTNGNGSKRIVIAKKGSVVTAKPTDQTIYTANENFGQGDALATGEYVVYSGSDYYVNLKNLEVGSTYHFAVFEYNVSGDGKPDYLTSSWLAATGATAGWPTTQTAISSVSNLTATGATINFTKGNGESRVFIMKQGSAVNVEPQDLVKYNYNGAFGTAAAHISGGNYVVALSNGTGSINVSNLQANTTYYVSAFEYNGSNEPAYLRTAPATISFTTPDVPGATVPTTPASSPLTNNVDGNKFTLKWTSGNGEKRIVVMRQGSAVSFAPASGTNYTANNSFGNGTDLGSGQYVMYNGTGNSVDLTNLQPSVTYYFTVFEYNGTGSLIRYLTSATLTATAATVSAPSTPASSPYAIAGLQQLTISWTNGDGSGRIVVMKEGSAVNAVPSALSVYPANAVFKNGSQIAANEYVVYAGSGNTVTVTGLQNKTYHFSIFEYNGSSARVYNTVATASDIGVVSTPLPIKLLYFTAKAQNNNVVLNWATAEEVNNSFFSIERSLDGSKFEAVRKIDGAINSTSVTEYSFTDAPAVTGKIYYRLKQTDIDGRSTYSNVAAVDINKQVNTIDVYPNPFQSQFKIALPGGINEAIITIYDSKGTLVIKQKMTTQSYVNASGWNSGVYYLNVQTGGKIYKSTIVKQ